MMADKQIAIGAVWCATGVVVVLGMPWFSIAVSSLAVWWVVWVLAAVGCLVGMWSGLAAVKYGMGRIVDGLSEGKGEWSAVNRE